MVKLEKQISRFIFTIIMSFSKQILKITGYVYQVYMKLGKFYIHVSHHLKQMQRIKSWKFILILNKTEMLNPKE